MSVILLNVVMPCVVDHNEGRRCVITLALFFYTLVNLCSIYSYQDRLLQNELDPML
jgi:hypothetical protein